MSLTLKNDAQYALLTATSMGVRLTPADRQPMHVGSQLEIQVTSAESNVVSVSSYLGLRTKILTKFVKGSPISRMIRDNLGHRHMDVEGPEVDQDGPWGHRHQMNLADAGFGPRAPQVWNDRSGEVGRTMSVDDFDLERIFGSEGVQIVHLSGLVAALSPETGTFCLELARAAKRHGTRISFDLNFRASFWENREKELREIFSEIAGVSDILVGNEEDFQLCLGIEGPEAGGSGLQKKIDGFKGMIARINEAYPDVSVYANTLREVVNANRHLWGALMQVDGEWHVVEPREIEVLDRIGGGDGFVGGLLYGVLTGKKPEEWIQLGWASGALAATMTTDYGQPANEAQIWNIWKGNARVQR